MVVGPPASLGLVAQEVQVGPPDDMPVPEEYYESEICNQVGNFIMGKEKIREKNFNEGKYSLCMRACVKERKADFGRKGESERGSEIKAEAMCDL